MKFIAFIFIIGSCIGWLMEVGFKYFSGQSITKAGMSKGPFCILYGMGALVLYLIVYKNISNSILIFFISAFLLTLLELISGIFLDIVFKLTLWDYSDKKLCINKHICGEFMISWGFIGVIFVKFIIPFIEKIFLNIDNEIGLVCIILISMIISLDYIIAVINRLKNRLKV